MRTPIKQALFDYCYCGNSREDTLAVLEAAGLWHEWPCPDCDCGCGTHSDLTDEGRRVADVLFASPEQPLPDFAPNKDDISPERRK